MPKTKISEFDTNPDNNTDINSINIAEGCAPSGINNAIRQLMADLKEFQTGAGGDPFNGAVNGTVGATTPNTGAFTTLTASGAFSANGGATLGDASGDALTINSSAVSIPNGLNFDSNTFVIDATNNRVGIGMASPVGSLTIQGAAGTSGINQGIGFLYSNGTQYGAIGLNNSSGWLQIMGRASAGLTFHVNSDLQTSGEAMRIDSSGNVGIGTSSPSFKLDVVGTTSQTRIRANATTAQTDFGAVNSGGALYLGLDDSTGATTGTAYASYIYSTAAKPLLFYTNGSLKATLDSSGNLGLGVTPSAWSGRAIQIGTTGGASLFNNSTGNAWLISNAFFDGAFKYVNTTFSAAYAVNNGVGDHRWYTAPSGTAGNAISFTQAMTLDASGRLGIGTSSPEAYLHTASSGLGDGGGIRIQNTGAGGTKFSIWPTANINGEGAGKLIVSGPSGNVMTYDSSGNVGIGTVSPSFRLDVRSTAGALGNFQLTTGVNAFIHLQDTVRSYGIFSNNGSWGIYDNTANTERMRIDSSGNLLLNTTSTTGTACMHIPATASKYSISFRSSATTGAACAFFNSSGGGVGEILIGSSSTTYATSSDYRLKENIAPMTGALAKVSALKPCTYTWKSTGEESQGFIAHELQEVVPECVTGEKDAVDDEGNPVYQGIDTSFLVATLTAAIKELKAELDTVKAELNTLKGN